MRLTGGEPAMAWGTVTAVLDEVASLRDHGIDLTVEVCTNGTLWDRSMFEAVRKPWARVVLSLDGTPASMEASGRRPVHVLDEFLALPGFMVTQTIAPPQAPCVLDNFLHLWNAGVRRFNFLPAYYVEWGAAEVELLVEGLDSVAEFLRPRVESGEAFVRNLDRVGSVPLFGDDVTVDADGRVYRTNLVLAGEIGSSLLPHLAAGGGEEPPPVPPDLRRRLLASLPAAARRSTRQVDRAMDRMVDRLAGQESRSTRGDPATGRRGNRPGRMEFHISYTCPNECTFCSESHRLDRWEQHPVSALEIRRVLVSHAAAGGSHVNLTGGEPTVHPAFTYALALARSLGMRTYVGTNGARLADPALAAAAMPLIDELSLSIHGGTDAVHDACTGRPGSFEGLIATARNARKHAPAAALFVNTVVTRLNREAVNGVVDLASGLGASLLVVSNAAPEGKALDAYGDLAVPLEAWPGMAAGIARAADAGGMVVRFFGLPMCVLGEARMKSNDLYWDPRVTVERGCGARGSVRLQTVIARRPRRGRRQTARCRGCVMREVCGGVFSEALDRFGDEAIHPIRG